MDHNAKDGNSDLKAFFIEHDMDKNDESRNVIILTYYSLTTLSSVGFGDYAPVSRWEYLGCTFLFLIVIFVWPLVINGLMASFEKLRDTLRDFKPEDELA